MDSHTWDLFLSMAWKVILLSSVGVYFMLWCVLRGASKRSREEERHEQELAALLMARDSRENWPEVLRDLQDTDIE